MVYIISYNLYKMYRKLNIILSLMTSMRLFGVLMNREREPKTNILLFCGFVFILLINWFLQLLGK